MNVRILVVDDNARFLESARTLLEREGMTVVGVASDAESALRDVQLLRPDVALVDVDLGGQSGLELARQIVERRGRASTQVILVSAYREEDLADLVADSPAVGFVSKAHLSSRAIVELLDGSPGQPTGGPPG
ncbi:MAG TPA: response regulator transcription factor [Acidimicrobiales bacterium]|nr:response regulator transcription factor [Acidimicrobiales bacterium]